MKKLFIFLIFTLALSFTIQSTYAISVDENISEYSEQKIVFLGDSITEGVGVTEDSERFGDIVSSTLGFDNYINMGVSGSTIAVRTSFTNSFAERAPSVPVDTDYVVVMGGINDYRQDIPLVDFSTDLETMINALETAAPNATIILMTPYETSHSGVPSSTANGVGATLDDYVDAIITTSDQIGDTTPRVNLIDLNNIIGFDASNNIEDKEKYTLDGVHTNIAGNIRIANILISFFSGDNLAETATWIEGSYVNSGSVASNANMSYSSLIEVEEGKTYMFYNKATGGEPLSIFGQYHDENGDYYQSIPNTPSYTYKVFTVPTGVDYVRINAQKDTVTNDEVFLREIENYETFVVTYVTYNDSVVTSEVLEYGDLVTRQEDPVVVDHTFVAWYLDEEFTELYDFDTPVTSDITLYAKWATNPSSGGVVVPSETLSILGIAWYWWLAGGAILYLSTSKKARKSLGFKK
jgi:uncharacterized repeat protein (TIGR02543 family)